MPFPWFLNYNSLHEMALALNNFRNISQYRPTFVQYRAHLIVDQNSFKRLIIVIHCFPKRSFPLHCAHILKKSLSEIQGPTLLGLNKWSRCRQGTQRDTCLQSLLHGLGNFWIDFIFKDLKVPISTAKTFHCTWSSMMRWKLSM